MINSNPELFWQAFGAIATLVGSIGLIISLIFIVKQISDTRKISSYQFLTEAWQKFYTDDMNIIRSRLAQIILSKPDPKPRQHYQIYQEAIDIIDYFEFFGMLVRKKIASDYSVWTIFSEEILNYWEILEKTINYLRNEKYRDKTFYIEFENLYKRMIKTQNKMNNEIYQPCSNKEIKEFLENELNIKIRLCTDIDLKRVQIVQKVCFDSVMSSFLNLESFISENPEGFYIIEVHKEVAGYLLLKVINNGIGYIVNMAIDPSFRGKSIGRKALEFAVDRFYDFKCKTCYIAIEKDNKIGITFYQKNDFIISVDKIDFINCDDKILIMKRSLFS